jgi:predicted O-methyltransferase YrrM
VVPGFVDPPRRSPADTAAIAAYNQRLAADPRLTATFLPVGDGVAVAIKREDQQLPITDQGAP